MQLAFSFAAECVKAYVRPAVLSMIPFNKSVVLEQSSAWAWNDGNVEIAPARVERCRVDAQGGNFRHPSYAAWLEWSSNLSASFVNGGAK